MQQYLDLIRHILANGNDRGDRTGTGTRSVFGTSMRFDLTKGFPLVTAKRTPIRSIIHELLWFLSGSTDNEKLRVATHGEGSDRDTIWEEWAVGSHSDMHGQLGPIYGKQWRSWEGANGETVDQISELIKGLKTKPMSRRHIVNAWNVADLPDETMSPQANVEAGRMALAPCHVLFQFYAKEMTEQERLDWMEKHLAEPLSAYQDGQSVGLAGEERFLSDGEIQNLRTSILREALRYLEVPKYKLSCQLYQRSCDVFLGLPFNIASYALLTMMVAQCANMAVDEFIWLGGDTHLYQNHMEQVELLLTREPKELPTMTLYPITDIFEFSEDHFTLTGYDPHPAIKAPVAI